jgi:hypothetical protein
MTAKPLTFEPPKTPKIGSIWLNKDILWKLFDITDTEYIFQTKDRLDEKKVQIKSFGRGWKEKNSWDDVPTKKPPKPSPCPCSIL